jgi:hypothetical protein
MMIAASPANAAYTCTGAVDSISQPWDGSVTVVSVALFGDAWGRTICNLNVTRNGVEPGTCRGWLAALIAARLIGNPVTFQYNDSLASCPQQPNFAAASAPWAIW